METKSIIKKRQELVREASKIGKSIRYIDTFIYNDNAKIRTKLVLSDDLTTINNIIDSVVGVSGVDEVSMLSNNRKTVNVKPRQCVMYMASKYTNCSLAVIGALLSVHRDQVYNHSTVLHAKKEIENALYLKNKKGIDDPFAAFVERCIDAFEGAEYWSNLMGEVDRIALDKIKDYEVDLSKSLDSQIERIDYNKLVE